MNLIKIARSIVVLSTGLIAGIFVGILATEPARFSLDLPNFVRLQQGIHVYYKIMMPPLVITAILSGIVWLFLLRKEWRSTAFLLAAVATTGSIAAFALTIIVNYPLNDLLMTWNAATPPANAMELWLTWERAHLIRTAIFVVAFVSAILAISVDRERLS